MVPVYRCCYKSGRIICTRDISICFSDFIDIKIYLALSKFRWLSTRIGWFNVYIQIQIQIQIVVVKMVQENYRYVNVPDRTELPDQTFLSIIYLYFLTELPDRTLFLTFLDWLPSAVTRNHEMKIAYKFEDTSIYNIHQYITGHL